MAESTVLPRLREAILSLDLAPGQALSERGLEPSLGASRTPIRAALIQLEGEGLVQRAGRGWIVAPLDVDELVALAEYRETLEIAGVRFAIERASDDELKGIALLVPSVSDADDAAQGIGSGTSFHHAIVALSGNPFLTGALDGVLTRLYRTRWLEVRTSQSREQAMREHHTIVTALMQRDAHAADVAIRAHLRGTMHRLVSQLDVGRQGLRARGVSISGGPNSTRSTQAEGTGPDEIGHVTRGGDTRGDSAADIR